MTLASETLNNAFVIVMLAITVAVILAVVVTLLIAFSRARMGGGRTRADALRAWAHDNGFTFDPTNTRSTHSRYQHLPAFTKGTDRIACNTMTTTVRHNGRAYALRFGDLFYTVGGRHRSVVYESYLVIETPFDRMAFTTIRPEARSPFTPRDIDLEDAEFSDLFLVRSKVRRFAYDLLHPRTMELLKHHAAGRMEFEIGDDAFAIIDTSVHQPLREPPAFLSSFLGLPISDDTRWSIPTFGAHIGLAHSLIELFPEHLIRDLEAGGAP